MSIVVNGKDEHGNRVAGIDRVLIMASLRRYVARRLFPIKCRVCGRNHRTRLDGARRTKRCVHPLAIPALREAMVPEWGIARIWVHKDGDSYSDEVVKKKALFMPFWVGDEQRTLRDQLAHAYKWNDRDRGDFYE